MQKKLPDGFLVVHQCLIEFSLLLQNGGQIGMSRCKLGKHFQSLQIQGCGLFNEALFPLDVGQIVQRVCMVGTQPSTEQRVKNRAISYTLLKKHIHT